MSTDFTDIEKNLPNGQNMGGIPQVVYYALHKDVASWPVRPKPTGSTLEKMGELSGNVVMKAGKAFRKFYVTDDEGKLDFEGVGEKDGKSFVLKLRIYSPGLTGKVMGLLNLIKNESLVFIVPDNNGNYFLLGDALRPATLDSIEAMTTGQKTEERPGVGMIFAYKTANVYRYKGNIPIVIPPTMIRACCPDGKDDYLSFNAGVASNLFMPTSSKKMICILDLIQGDCTFEFQIKDTFMYNFSLISGNAVIMLFINGKGYVILFKSNITDNKRLKVRLELGLENNAPTFAAFINDAQVPSEMQPTEEVTSPTVNGMNILTARGGYFTGKLFSFEIFNGTTSIAKWDFQGKIPDECLKNKNNSMYPLTAHNVDDMNQFIKDIPIPE